MAATLTAKKTVTCQCLHERDPAFRACLTHCENRTATHTVSFRALAEAR